MERLLQASSEPQNLERRNFMPSLRILRITAAIGALLAAAYSEFTYDISGRVGAFFRGDPSPDCAGNLDCIDRKEREYKKWREGRQRGEGVTPSPTPPTFKLDIISPGSLDDSPAGPPRYRVIVPYDFGGGNMEKPAGEIKIEEYLPDGGVRTVDPKEILPEDGGNNGQSAPGGGEEKPAEKSAPTPSPKLPDYPEYAQVPV